MPWAEVDGCRISWRLDGEGPTLVEVGGLATGPRNFDFVNPFLMSAGWSVLTFAPRGFAPSSSFPGQTPVEWADDLAAVVRASGLSQYVVVSTGTGSIAALLSEFRHRGKAAGIVLDAPFVHCDSVLALRVDLWKELASRIGTSPPFADHLLLEALDGATISMHPELVPWLRKVVGSLDVVSYVRACRLLPTVDLRTVRDVSVPCLIVGAKGDELTHRGDAARPGGYTSLTSTIPHAQLHAFPGLAHASLIARPKEAADVITAFARRCLDQPPPRATAKARPTSDHHSPVIHPKEHL